MLTAERPPVAAVVQQHADEAAHLHAMRRVLVRAPHVGLLHLRRLDERIAAHFDGLMESGEAGRALCRDALAEASADALFVATTLALQARDADGLGALLALAAALPDTHRGVRAAYGWASAASLRGATKPLLDAPDAFRRGLGLSACAMHQVDPGAALAPALTDSDPQLRILALRVAAACGRRDLLPLCLAGLADADSGSEAARAALLLGDRESSVQALLSVAGRPGPSRIDALQLVLKTLAPPDAHRLLKSLAQDPADLPALVAAVGAAGDTHYMAWLLTQMSNPLTARPAGAAFSLITGIDLIKADLEAPAPEAEPGPNDDPDDTRVEPDDDEGLPWPDTRKAAQWWQSQGHQLPPGARHFMGKVPSAPQALLALTAGTQRQRVHASQYLALLQPGSLLFNIAAPAWRQDRSLARMRGDA